MHCLATEHMVGGYSDFLQTAHSWSTEVKSHTALSQLNNK